MRLSLAGLREGEGFHFHSEKRDAADSEVIAHLAPTPSRLLHQSAENSESMKAHKARRHLHRSFGIPRPSLHPLLHTRLVAPDPP